MLPYVKLYRIEINVGGSQYSIQASDTDSADKHQANGATKLLCIHPCSRENCIFFIFFFNSYCQS